MHEPSVILLIVVLIICLVFIAFFSGSETGLMSINRYRLKHQAKTSKSAKRAQQLLSRPDRLLGVILLGNTFVTILASSVATIIAIHYYGDQGAIIASVVMTLVLLIFAEVSPKTLAALYPEQVSYVASLPLKFLLRLLYPLVWSINTVSNGLLRLFGISFHTMESQGFTQEELRTLVLETSGRIPSKNRMMLLSILDLEKATVDDIMIPRNEVVGLDLDHEWSETVSQLAHTQHTFLPVYQQDLNNLLGIIHAKKALMLLANPDFNEEHLKKALDEGFFVPQGTSLTKQLINFQHNHERFALVVDEYGDILGLVTLADLLEEIVGEFTTNISEVYTAISLQSDGSYLVEGSTTIREFNHIAPFKLPTHGAKTVNGLIIDYLQTIPEVGTCCLINRIPIEVIQVQDNRIKSVKIFPPLPPKEE